MTRQARSPPLDGSDCYVNHKSPQGTRITLIVLPTFCEQDVFAQLTCIFVSLHLQKTMKKWKLADKIVHADIFS